MVVLSGLAQFQYENCPECDGSGFGHCCEGLQCEPEKDGS